MEAGNALDFSCKYFCFLSFRVQGAQTSAFLRVGIYNRQFLSTISSMDYKFCGHFGSQGSKSQFWL